MKTTWTTSCGSGALALALSSGIMVSPALAAPVITTVNTNLTAVPFTFSFLGSSFSLTGNGAFPNIIAISTSGSDAARTVFGTPSTDFVNRGTVVYDANVLGGYSSLPLLTPVPFSNGDNFLGLRVTSAGQNYYGFLFTTNSTLNSYGFETTANTGITATTALASATPEPATWGMMILGFGLAGTALRRRRQVTIRVSYVV